MAARLPQLPELDFEAMSAEDILRWAYSEYGDGLCLTCSWQKQSSVLVHMVSELGLADRHHRARHAALLPRDVRDARPAGRALRPHARARAAHPDGRRAAPAGAAEPLGDRPGPLLPHPQGRAAARGARALRRLGLGDPPRPVAEPRGHAEAAALRALRRPQGPPARRLGREARLGLHPRQRDPLQPAARLRLPLDRLHPLHQADRTRRGGAGRPLGRLGQARVRDPSEHADNQGD